MNIEPALTGLALYILIWMKLPEWGSWFNRLLEALPRPIQQLYDYWHCPYCCGFWVALLLHGLTGIWTLETLAVMAMVWGWPGMVAAWFFDALVTGTFMLFGKLLLDALGLAAIRGMQLRDELMTSRNANQEARA